MDLEQMRRELLALSKLHYTAAKQHEARMFEVPTVFYRDVLKKREELEVHLKGQFTIHMCNGQYVLAPVEV